jgi:nonsense-mediated mRNA decay protein 3
MICIECGKNTKLYDNLCEDCFKSKKQLVEVPEIIDLKLCTHCGARERGKQWLDESSIDEAVENTVQDKIIIDNEVEASDLDLIINFEDDKNLQVKVSITLFFKTLQIESEHNLRVRLKSGICNRCSKIAGDYYESIIQVRGDDRNLSSDELKKAQNLVETEVEVMQAKDRSIFITKTEKIHGGINFYIGNTQGGRNLAKLIAATFNAKISSHPSFAGHKNGHGIYRTTFLVKLPKFRNGDIIEVEHKLIKIIEYKTTKVPAIDLEKGIKVFIKPKDVHKGKLLGYEDDLVQEAVVVAETKHELQVLDPDTYKTIDVIKPRSFCQKGDTVKLIKYKDNIYIIT